MVLLFAWDSCRCMWTCFLWLVCINSTHAHVLNQLRQATTESFSLWLSREGDSCSAVNCHVLCTFVCNSTACHGAWQHLNSARLFYVHCLSAIIWLCLPHPQKIQTCNMFALSYWHCCFFYINCQFNLTF